MKTVAVVYGTRPEAIKLAPLISELKKSNKIKTVVICTGQHKEMLDGILDIWGLTNDVFIPSNFSKIHSSGIPNLMIKLEEIFKDLSLDLVVVQGDTATATAGALQAHALRIPVAHVEAGLRSGDIWNPWPEESNRRIIDSISSLHFAPTKSTAENLALEGHRASTFITGNTIVDALHHSTRKLDRHPEIQQLLESTLGFRLEEDFILFTQHRREGFGDGQNQVFGAIVELAKAGHKIVFPVHLNPLVQDKVNKMLLGIQGIYLISPQTYLPFLTLVRKCQLIISDSGGLQEEAPTFGKRILITRLTTERPEVIACGLGNLVGYDSDEIVKQAENACSAVPLKKQLMNNPFGDGDASNTIKELILGFLTC